MSDRLAEIKGLMEYAVPSDDGFDEIEWLIEEVERLRIPAGILTQLIGEDAIETDGRTVYTYAEEHTFFTAEEIAFVAAGAAGGANP